MNTDQHKRALELRELGYTYRNIGLSMKVSTRTARSLVETAKKHRLPQTKKQQEQPLA
jgi:orotate phosphoribosyltransferase-like protein